jgi:hypothetical protein
MSLLLSSILLRVELWHPLEVNLFGLCMLLDEPDVLPCNFRSPSVSRIRSKMLYATSKQRFMPALDGVHYEIQATDPSELDIDVLRDHAH